LAADWGAAQHGPDGIRVNAAAPGFVYSQWFMAKVDVHMQKLKPLPGQTNSQGQSKEH
jgi:NAD(P)-dependent dehydrogenase (short-subunit alcohol dehydrogenase family)